MMRIFKDPKSPHYFLDYVDPRTGRRRRISTRCKTKADAESWARRFLAVLHGEAPPPTEAVYLSHAVREFLEVRGPMLRSAWRHGQAFQVILRILGDVPLRAITPDALYDYQRRRLREGVSPTTVRRELAYLSSLMTFAVRRGWIDENPVRRVDKPKEPPPRQDYFRPEEVRALLATPTTPAMRLAFLMSLTAGLRRGEILALRRADVLLDTGLIVIRHDKANRFRTVPIPKVLEGELRAYLATHDYGEYVFPWRGLGWRKAGIPSGFKTAWYAWLRRAGVRRLRFHDVRHTFATYFAQATGNLHELAGILGHGSAYTTQRYAHLIEDYRERLARRIDSAMASVLAEPDLAEKWQKTAEDFSTKWLQ